MIADPLPPNPPDPRPPAEAGQLLPFLFRLGQAYLACGEQTAKIELMLRRVATAYGMRQARVVAFPTAIFISLHDGVEERVTLAECDTQALRLDQMADVYALGDAAQTASIDLGAALERLAAIRRQQPRFGRVGAVAGHTILTAGLAIVLMPTPENLAVASALGLVVGLLKIFNRGRAVLSVPLPVVAATLVSTLVFLLMRNGVPVDPLHALIPPLVTFLPGAMLTLGMVELAYGDMVSGASRLITGLVHLVLLAFGLAVGAIVTGYVPADLSSETVAAFVPAWTPWAGVVVFGLGVYLHFSAPRNSLLWLIVSLLTAFAAQKLAAPVVGNELSGFFGTLLVTPLAYLIEMRFRGPPAVVTFLPSFWLLVPGALGLLSVTRMLSDRANGIEGMITVVFVITSVAIGTLVGASLYRWVTETFGEWRMQIARVATYFRDPPR